MANGDIPRSSRKPSIRPGPIQTFLPQRLQAPAGMLDQEADDDARDRVLGVRNHAGAGARGVMETGGVVYALESLEKDALMMGRHIPEDARYGLDGRIIIRVQELKRRAYFNKKELRNVGRLPVAPFARRKINDAAMGIGEDRMFIERVNMEKACDIGKRIEDGLTNAGLRSIFDLKSFGLALTPEFLDVCIDAARMRGHDLNKDMGSLVMKVNDAITAAGVGITEQSFRYMLEKLLEGAANLERRANEDINAGENEEKQQQLFQRYLMTIPKGGGYGFDRQREIEMFGQVMDGIADTVSDANLELSYLGLRQICYTGLQKSLTGRDMLVGVAAAKKYLFERYLMEYMKWLLGNAGRE